MSPLASRSAFAARSAIAGSVGFPSWAFTQEIAAGDYSVRSSDTDDDDLGRIARGLNQMAASLETTFTDLKQRDWLQTGAVRLAEAIRGERELASLRVLGFWSRVDDAIVNVTLSSSGGLITRERQNAARIRFIEDASLLSEVGGVGAILRFRI